jgi:hypothetical protein
MRKRIAALAAFFFLFPASIAGTTMAPDFEPVSPESLTGAYLALGNDDQGFAPPTSAEPDASAGVGSALACVRETTFVVTCEELGTDYKTFMYLGDVVYPSYYLRYDGSKWSCKNYEDGSGYCIDFSGEADYVMAEAHQPDFQLYAWSWVGSFERFDIHAYLLTPEDPNLQFPLIMWGTLGI